MKFLVQFSRILTGMLFIFSGMVKLNDPSGFAIKLDEYFDVFAEDVAQKQDSLKIELTDGGKTIAVSNFVLFNSDRSRELSVRQNTEVEVIQPPVDSTEKIKVLIKKTVAPRKIYHVTVTAEISGNPVGEIKMDFNDSASSSMLGVKAGVAGNVIYQKDIRVIPFNTEPATASLNLSTYVKPESWLYNLFKGMKTWSLYFSVFFCALEVVLGFALLVGWSIGLTSWLMLLLILFFTFLTGYSWIYNKVTDCGCFGDFIKLKPKESFLKDVVLTILIGIIFFGRKYIKPLFSKSFGWKFISVISLLSAAFGIYCYLFLPVWDFLPYKEGNQLIKIMTEVPKGMRARDSVEIQFVLKKGSDTIVVSAKDYTSGYEKFEKEGWEYKDRRQQTIIEGWKSPIKDFSISDPKNGENLTDTVLSRKGYKLFLACTYLNKTNKSSIKRMGGLQKWAKGKGIPFYPVTATGSTAASEFTASNGLDFSFLAGDYKMLLSMARFNPTLYLMKDDQVVRKWSGLNFPSDKRLNKLTSR